MATWIRLSKKAMQWMRDGQEIARVPVTPIDPKNPNKLKLDVPDQWFSNKDAPGVIVIEMDYDPGNAPTPVRNPAPAPAPAKPKPLAGKKVALDPGHGIDDVGFDSGAIGNGLQEAEQVLIQAQVIQQYLVERGATVRVINDRLSLTQIGAQGNNSDLFVSLHLNSFNKSARGHEVLVETQGTAADLKLATVINNELSKEFPEIPDRGVKKQSLAVLRGLSPKVPGVLVESFFIDSADAKLPNVTKRTAQAIARGIEKFLAQ